MIALVAIAKNEDRYIEEWLDYNRKLGFDHIYLYMNNWTTNVEREWFKINKQNCDVLDTLARDFMYN